MKKLLFTTAFLAVVLLCGAQGTWTMLNPNPTLKDLIDVSFATEEKGWVVGRSGIILHTDDGGENWEMQHYDAQDDLWGVWFVDEYKGWAVGWDYIYHTDDGGENWESQNPPVFVGDLFDVFFLNHDTGWVVGTYEILFKTIDGGENWEKISNNLSDTKFFDRVLFTDANHGIVVGSQNLFSDGLIMITEDGGYTWNETTPAGFSGFNDVYFRDSLHGWVCGNDYKIVSTNDGGYTWTEIPVPASGFRGIHFYTEEKGILVDSYHTLFSFDGGMTWDSNGYIGAPSSLRRFRSFGGDFGVAVGFKGAMVKTLDGGNTWQTMKKGLTGSIFDIGFFNTFDGLTISGSASESHLYRTFDGGFSWVQDSIINEGPCYMMRIIGQTCFILSSSHKLLVSYNAGTDWEVFEVPSVNWQYSDMHFVNNNTGYLCGYNGEIFKTNDGGHTWTDKSLSSSNVFIDLFFVTENLGWLIESTMDKVYRTTDGGNTWDITTLEDYIVCQPQRLWFLDEQVGFATTYEGKLFKTSDGGDTWESIVNLPGAYEAEIIFTDNDYAWYKSLNKLYHSTDGGNTWSGPKQFEQGILTTMFFFDETKGWVGGHNGFISMYDYIVSQPDIQHTKPMLQLQPNPANDFIKISTGDLTEIKSIRVFDVFGREVHHVELKRALHAYILDLSAFAPGTYLLQTESNTGKKAAKFVKK